VLWREEKLIHLHAVRRRDHCHDPNVCASQSDDPEVLCPEPLFMKPPLFIVIPTIDLLHVLLEGGPLRAVGELAIVRAHPV